MIRAYDLDLVIYDELHVEMGRVVIRSTDAGRVPTSVKLHGLMAGWSAAKLAEFFQALSADIETAV